jgi:predicted RNA methylase
MSQLFTFDTTATAAFTTEPEVEAYADHLLRSEGFTINHRKCGNEEIDKSWPSKALSGGGKGVPDILLRLDGSKTIPFCVWENKAPTEPVETAIKEAQFYIEGLHRKLPAKPNLPRLAAGFNGQALRISYFNHLSKWVDVKVEGSVIVNFFPKREFAFIGISATGNFNAFSGTATAADLRNSLPALKTLYRSIPVLASGRRPIDFTVALLTLKMLLELQDWGTWAEQPGLVPDASSLDHAIGERFKQLANRVLDDHSLKAKYGDIFHFKEQTKSNEEVAFDFIDVLSSVELGNGYYEQMFNIVDRLPPVHGADFDVFGEVYQVIGDDATKRALGEFFTGRHIISAVVPILLERAGVKMFDNHLKGKRIADIACGTGGFLTETLRHVRRKFQFDEKATKAFASKAFYGYDLSHSNASRARVNMYFAGDGFSTIDGGVDSLAYKFICEFDFILTNPPYGSSAKYQRLEEAFLRKIISLLRDGSGWGLVVLPTGVLENPRSADVRFHLLKTCRVTDIISLPKHSFAPYTLQRTAVVIFEKRAQPLTSADWGALLKEVGHEELSLFIVDNDGFANSDKRYETSRKSPRGEWLHDDLRSWLDGKTGTMVEGKLFRALIKKQPPTDPVNEFGVPQGPKYSFLALNKLASLSTLRGANKASGLDLLPDTYLRPSLASLSFKAFCAEALVVAKALKNPKAVTVSSQSVLERAKQLLITNVDFTNAGTKKAKLKTIGVEFELKKGDPGLTEAIIYNQFDPGGIPVYGGGESTPRFFVRADAKTKSSKDITVHSAPLLIVSMDGSSGATRAINKGQIVCNHHACVLKPKRGLKLDLDFVAQQIEGGLKNLASNQEGSATLTLPALTSFQFQTTDEKKEMKKIASLRRSLLLTLDKFR